jgi:hypothetical protein
MRIGDLFGDSDGDGDGDGDALGLDFGLDSMQGYGISTQYILHEDGLRSRRGSMYNRFTYIAAGYQAGQTHSTDCLAGRFLYLNEIYRQQSGTGQYRDQSTIYVA